MSESGADRQAWAALFDLRDEVAEEPQDDESPRRGGLFRRLRDNLTKPRETVAPQLMDIVNAAKLGDDTWDELEEALIAADCGAEVAMDLVAGLRREAAEGRITSGASLAGRLWEAIGSRMAPEAPRIPLSATPTVILVVGVNGSGKTTTIGKLAYRLSELGQSVVIGAGDTFRAAAIDQLAIWAERSGAHLVRQGEGSDPGAVAFDAVASGVAREADVVLIDTAGRLQTQHNLMEELRKVAGVVGKALPSAPHETLLVMDSTTGQNGLSQARLFHEAINVTGIALTKLDGTARGGIAVAINQDLGIPVKIVGSGEKVEDLQPFDARTYAEAIFSVE